MPMLFEDDGPRVAALEDKFDEVAYHLEGLDYVAECDKTASNVFTPENVGVYELQVALHEFILAAQVLNRYKKALFRKQSRIEAGLSPSVHGPDLTTFRIAGHDDLFHGVIGVATEAGELAEALHKLLSGQGVSQDNIREEIGDNLWYITRLIKWAETTFLAEMKRNIAKLRERHGKAGFNKERDMNRDLGREADVLAEGNWQKPVGED